MFLTALAALLGLADQPSTYRSTVAVRSTATVRIVQASKGNSSEWSETPRWKRREMTISGERGEKIIVRLIEHQ